MLFTLMLVLSAQLSLAETIKSKKIKEEMLTRADTLIQKSDEGRELAKKEKMDEVCVVLNDIFDILPDQLISIGTHMDIGDSKIIKLERETRMYLMQVHYNSNLCKNDGNKGESLQIKDTEKLFKSMKKDFEKHKKRIKKSDTDFENSYNYYYEFR